MVIMVEAIMNLAGVTVCERYIELDEFNLRKFQERLCGNDESSSSLVAPRKVAKTESPDVTACK